jgi:hypothetical protein
MSIKPFVINVPLELAPIAGCITAIIIIHILITFKII